MDEMNYSIGDPISRPENDTDHVTDTDHDQGTEIENPNPSIATPDIPNEMPAREHK